MEHPRIRPGALEDRRYQRLIAEHALRENVLAVLPTGSGKTAIAVRLMAELLERFPERSQLFLAPTRPLVVQHARYAERILLGPSVSVYTGEVPPERRRGLFHPPTLLFATPQVVENDLARGELSPGEFSVVIFDEAHRAVGDYPYVALGRAFRSGSHARLLGMTASPGSSREKVVEVLENLGVAPTGIEYLRSEDPELQRYLNPIEVESLRVENPKALQEIASLLREALERQVARLRARGYFPEVERVGRGELLRLGEALRGQRAVQRSGGEKPPAAYWEVVSAQSIAMKAFHALDLAETQGVESLRKFFDRMVSRSKGRRSPSDSAFLHDPSVVAARARLEGLELEHPKVHQVVELVRKEISEHPGTKVIVFAHYRDTAQVLTEELARAGAPGVRAARFVGQASHGASDVGLSQRDQVEILDRFRRGELNCLVATSVAEEGLDIPDTDLVIFYEPVPSEIRTIQRRGRTGRFHAGRVVVLLAQGTRDQVSQFASRGKERRMLALLEEIAASSRPLPPVDRSHQATLEQF